MGLSTKKVKPSENSVAKKIITSLGRITHKACYSLDIRVDKPKLVNTYDSKHSAKVHLEGNFDLDRSGDMSFEIREPSTMCLKPKIRVGLTNIWEEEQPANIFLQGKIGGIGNNLNLELASRARAQKIFPQMRQEKNYKSTLGNPHIQVINANHENRSELLLKHVFHGYELDIPFARHTLLNLAHIWTRPVHLITQIDDRKIILSHDGENYKEAVASG